MCVSLHPCKHNHGCARTQEKKRNLIFTKNKQKEKPNPPKNCFDDGLYILLQSGRVVDLVDFLTKQQRNNTAFNNDI